MRVAARRLLTTVSLLAALGLGMLAGPSLSRSSSDRGASAGVPANLVLKMIPGDFAIVHDHYAPDGTYCLVVAALSGTRVVCPRGVGVSHDDPEFGR